VDLKALSTQMVDGYLGESLRQVALGAGLIAFLLVVGLRSAVRAGRVIAPCLAALALATAVLVALGTRISVFHLVALLLVLGIGLNYALFLENAGTNDEQRERTRQALALCVATTVITFGVLAFSTTPVLRAIGATVALGAVLALALAVAWLGTPRNPAARTVAP
jgi:predicted exporter